MDGVEEEGGVPSRLIKTDRLVAGKEGTPMTHVRTLPVGEDSEEITVSLDELAREGARRMIAAAFVLRLTSTSSATRTNSTRTGTGSWSATAAHASGR